MTRRGRVSKIVIALLLSITMMFGLNTSKAEATTEYFGEIENAWILGAYSQTGSIIQMSDGTLYASGYNEGGQLGLGTSEARRTKFTKVIFHNSFYGTGKRIIQATNANTRGFLLDDKGNVYYSSLETTDQRGDVNILAKASYGTTFPSSVDANRATTTTLTGRNRGDTRGEYVIHQPLADWSAKTGKKIVKIAGNQSALIFETSDGSLWGIGGGGEANNHANNVLGLGSTVSTDDGNGNYVKQLSENVEAWSAEKANYRNSQYEYNTLFFKTNGEWFALGGASTGKTLTGLSKAYIANSDFNNSNTVNGQAGIGRKVDPSIINTKYGTSYTHADIKQMQPNLGRTEILTTDGKLYTVGLTFYGSVPNEANTGAADSAVPILNKVVSTDSYKAKHGANWGFIEEVYPSQEGTWVRMSTGHIWARGSNDQGDLGYRTNPVAAQEFILTDITDTANTGRMAPPNTYDGTIQQSPETTINPQQMAIGYNATMMISSEGYIMGSGPTTYGFYGSDNVETNYNRFGFTRVKRDYRVVRNPQIVVNGDNNPISWLVNPEDIKIGKSTEWADKNAGTYPTYAEFSVYGCGTTTGVYTSKEEVDCTIDVGGTNKIGTGAGAAYSTAHEANKIDDTNLYNINLNNLGLTAGYYKIVAKRYAFIGPNGTGLSGVNKGTLQYNEEGTDDEYFVEFKIDPVITAEEYIELNVGDTYNPETGVSAKDSKNQTVNFGSGQHDLQYTSNVDTTTVGVYKVTYTMADQYDE
ncbi:DUF5011 domain-containing protein, partial [Erysipelotrichaceae bacterium OttesenSCG-928-M19]|nr:DUF5011 domain-containing protein [Erysipelotrichaceae bacterium OttesenSCG-928-M19]